MLRKDAPTSGGTSVDVKVILLGLVLVTPLWLVIFRAAGWV